jgi:hypothetical protein
MQRPSFRGGALLAAAALILALGGAPLLVTGADHLDAPALGGLTSMGAIAPHSEHGDRDINDVYVFEGANASRTVLAMTTNPAINLFGGSFGTNVRYAINIDRNGDAKQDLAYVWRFGAPNGAGAQSYTVTRYTGANSRSYATGVRIGSGSTGGSGIGTAKDGAKIFAGVRSDPFFFDLLGFVGTVFGVGGDALGNDPSDFFFADPSTDTGLDTNALVVEVPDDAMGAVNIGVWGTTAFWNGSSWMAADQMGRPAINTVFNTSLVDPNSGQTKDRFNTTPPAQQSTAFGGLFRTNVIVTLTNINAALGTGCPDYDVPTAEFLAGILLPDVITYNTGTPADGEALNGRNLDDDVIDAELAITTNGCVTSDGVEAHGDYLSSFPYLGVPHDPS